MGGGSGNGASCLLSMLARAAGSRYLGQLSLYQGLGSDGLGSSDPATSRRDSGALHGQGYS